MVRSGAARSGARSGSLPSLRTGSAPDCTDLWRRFWERRDRSARNELALAYEPLVHTTVRRLPAHVRNYWDKEDLAGFGLLGLLEAIDRWTEGSDASHFPAYAIQRIRGAIFDELRRLDWLTRAARRRVVTYRVTMEALSSELGRVPDAAEVLEGMGVDADAGAELLRDVQASQLLHLEHAAGDPDAEEPQALIDLITADAESEPEPQLLAAEQIAEIRRAVTSLPERQRTVVLLHFLGGLTQAQIGRLLGVSNSRVCQIEASAIETLRKVLAAPTNPTPSRCS